jgi:hypothetical protein
VTHFSFIFAPFAIAVLRISKHLPR